ncbi:nSTAND1 domain-containing NTPase [Streptomyces sp. H27-D2]|uniref:nSTAND1 domain-containing NTPase n=1 Tax=Streptomyces sp. H27-D2 TaxID=3046304 RepID=UPI002DBDF9D2|nr:hypothetical protein [Streptomyces sp. H27-D2]MEC4021061.1 hypothetical protein [Streptomyces sp. H27-D2]
MPRGERPLDAGDTALLRFAADLRRLRQKAAHPTYRQLSERAHYSIATLSDAAGGRKLPTLAVTLAYVRACDGDTAQWEQRWHDLAAELAVELAADAAHAAAGSTPESETPPYVGLSAFQPQDADRYFGRERLVEDVTTRLSQQRFLAVFGASGSGKSSLLRAGLLPRLRAEGDSWAAVVLTPGPHPLEECAIQLAGLGGMSAGALRDELAADRFNLHRVVRQFLADRPPQTDIVLVIDQFEEVFTVCRDPEERTAFIAALVTAAQTRNSRCRVLLGVRADFYAHCTRHADLIEALRDAQIAVGPMSTDELRRAITEPALRAGYRVEGALLAALTAHAHDRAGVLPLLSHALLETWRRRRGTMLTLEAFQAAGGFQGALAQTAESFYATLDASQCTLARQIFLRLTALGEGTEDTKRRVPRDELDDTGPDTAVVLERAAHARLLTLGQDRVEITHEALIGCWPRLSRWLAEDRDGLRLHRQLTDATQVWESLGRDPDVLYRGTRLAGAQELIGAGTIALTAREQRFLDACGAAERARNAIARRRVRQLRHLVALLMVLLVAAVAGVGYALHAQRVATGQRNVALSREVSAKAVALRYTDPPLAVQLSLAAYRLVPSDAARNGLVSTLTTQLVGHTQVVSSVAVGSDGRTLATGSFDRTVRLWDVSDRRHPTRLSVLTGHTDTVSSVAFSPDGHTLASTGRDRTIRLWNVADARRPVLLSVLTGHTDTVFSVVFSPDGHTLATGSYDHTARLWDVSDPQHPGRLATLTGHRDFVDCLAFSPDGRTLASGSDDRTIRLWNVTDPRRPGQLAPLTGHADVVASVAFSPDGRTLASASDDRSVRTWNVVDLRHPSQQAMLTGHTGAVTAVAFSLQGRTIVTASADHTAQVWEADPHRAMTRACESAHPTVTSQQWERYFPGVAYRAPCP